MHRLSRFAVPPAALLVLLAATACSRDEEAKPPPSGAKLCGVTMASWWFDATGASDLSGRLRGGLPLPNPTQTEYTTTRATCIVYSGEEQVGRFVAEIPPEDNLTNTAAQIAERPADARFTSAGGKGMAEPKANNDGAEAWWTCKSAFLHIEVNHPKDADKRVELTKTLSERVASVVGCPEHVSAPPE